MLFNAQGSDTTEGNRAEFVFATVFSPGWYGTYFIARVGPKVLQPQHPYPHPNFFEMGFLRPGS